MTKTLLTKEQEDKLYNDLVYFKQINDKSHFKFTLNLKKYLYSEEFILKIFDQLNGWDFNSLFYSDEFYIENYSEETLTKIAKKSKAVVDDRVNSFKNRLFSEYFLNKNFKHIKVYSYSLKNIAHYQKLSEDFIIKNIEYLDTELLLKNKNIEQSVKDNIIALKEII